jgi:hypothetical protein
MLVGAATLALLGAAAACGKPAPRLDVDALVAQLDRAQADSELAATVATTAPPPVAKALTAIAAERAAHAQALTDELTRMNGAPTPTAAATTTSSTTTTTTTTMTGEPPQPPTTKDVVASLRQAADAAATAAAQQSGYRAGLLGSIAASCTTAFTVALGGGQDT